MAGTTGLEPATSAVTGQRSDQLSYVPRLFFNNLVVRHIESSVSQLSLFSLFSTISPLWTQFWASVDTTWTPRWTPKPQTQRQDKVYQMTRDLVSTLPSHGSKFSFSVRLLNAIRPNLPDLIVEPSVGDWPGMFRRRALVFSSSEARDSGAAARLRTWRCAFRWWSLDLP
jgi:hypothetical protein